MKRIEQFSDWLKKQGLFPDVPIVNSSHSSEVIINNKKVLLFASNNYLGLMKDPRVVDAAKKGLEKWGIGSGGARLLTGNLDVHNQLEKVTADLKKREASLSFVSGYMANTGAISAIAVLYKTNIASILSGKTKKDRSTVIFSDEHNHASIIAGIKASGCPKEVYYHRNMSDLENRLKKYSKRQRKMIISDSIFSMEGTIAPLPEIVSLAKKYNAITYIDDAHATGVFGEEGRGIEDYFNLEGSVDIVMGTYTKAFGGVGGFVASNQKVIDCIKVTAESFIFTAPIAPPVSSGLIKAIDIAEKETWRRKDLIENAEYLRDKMDTVNLNYMDSETQIIPVLIGNEKKAMKASELLFERGIFIPIARWPAVPKGKARLRVTVSCEHTKDQIDILVNELKKLKEELGF